MCRKYSVLVSRVRSFRFRRVCGIVMCIRMFLRIIAFLMYKPSFRMRCMEMHKKAYFLGDKRRKIGEGNDGEPDQIREIVRLYGRFADADESKIFANADYGYTRVTVERPLRLRYQMTVSDKARFLNACPHLLDDVQAVDK